MFKDKCCKICSAVFTPRAACNLYCSDKCKQVASNKVKDAKRVKAYARWVEKQIACGREFAVGVGRGGTAKRFKENKSYKNGMGEFARLREVVKLRSYCERCNKDLREIGSFSWACHHKDHNRANNVIENLELLCKRCHQIEHKCWQAFEGVTTRATPVESSDSKCRASRTDEDIV